MADYNNPRSSDQGLDLATRQLLLKIIDDTFTQTNVSSQVPRFNRMIWLRLKEFVRRETVMMTMGLWVPKYYRYSISHTIGVKRRAQQSTMKWRRTTMMAESEGVGDVVYFVTSTRAFTGLHALS